MSTMFEKGTIMHSVYRGLLVFASFGLVTLFNAYPEWGTVTLGAIVSAIVHYVASNLETKS